MNGAPWSLRNNHLGKGTQIDPSVQWVDAGEMQSISGLNVMWWRRGRGLALLGAWLTATLAGFGVLVAYGYGAGAAGAQPAAWPSDAGDTARAGRHTLIVFTHPRCPCTVATMRELARLSARVESEVDIRIAMFVPHGEPDAWAQGAVWRAARTVASATIEIDRGGRLARLFGASTSGHAALYDRGGRLVFSGGLTAARGHEGMSLGRSSVELWTLGGEGAASAPVFGCTLLGADDACDGAACGDDHDGIAGR